MEWWWLINVVLAWGMGIFILRLGLRISKATYDKGTLDSPNIPTLIGDLSFIVFIIELILGFLGLIMKYSPWWLAKFYVILFAFLLFYFGFLAISFL